MHNTKILLTHINRSRALGKAMLRVYKKMDLLVNALEKIELQQQVDKEIIVAITDDQPPSYFDVDERHEGFFQITAGCPFPLDDNALATYVFQILLKAIRLYPFSESEHESFEALFERMRLTVTTGFNPKE